ncbi:GFA family protein [Gymnodinialimonas ulvae]|uniref:GFA family protein n=1 Tax=Gymnodinialimonas ulvae TaxID=3126504 RepID=UPI0030955339
MKGACHCGAVTLDVELSEGLATARRCDCSFCRMRGAVTVSAPRDGLRVVTGAEHLALYQFGTRRAEHYFCRLCGIYTHHRRFSNPDEYGVNVAILVGHSPFDFDTILVLDGQNDPAGTSTEPVVGTLTYKAHK